MTQSALSQCSCLQGWVQQMGGKGEGKDRFLSVSLVNHPHDLGGPYRFQADLSSKLPSLNIQELLSSLKTKTTKMNQDFHFFTTPCWA